MIQEESYTFWDDAYARFQKIKQDHDVCGMYAGPAYAYWLVWFDSDKGE